MTEVPFSKKSGALKRVGLFVNIVYRKVGLG